MVTGAVRHLDKLLDDSSSDDNELHNDENRPHEIKKLTRKRLRHPENWKKNRAKKQRNSGLEYINSKGQTVKSKVMLKPCLDKCRLKCKTNITENERQIIFDSYWKLQCIDAQRNFVNSCMMEISPSYRNPKPARNRSKNIRYTLTVGSRIIPVCKTFFKNTLGINNRTIFTVTKKKDEQGFLQKDQRGKHTKHNKVSESVIATIKDILILSQGSIPTIAARELKRSICAVV